MALSLKQEKLLSLILSSDSRQMLESFSQLHSAVLSVLGLLSTFNREDLRAEVLTVHAALQDELASTLVAQLEEAIHSVSEEEK